MIPSKEEKKTNQNKTQNAASNDVKTSAIMHSFVPEQCFLN